MCSILFDVGVSCSCLVGQLRVEGVARRLYACVDWLTTRGCAAVPAVLCVPRPASSIQSRKHPGHGRTESSCQMLLLCSWSFAVVGTFKHRNWTVFCGGFGVLMGVTGVPGPTGGRCQCVDDLFAPIRSKMKVLKKFKKRMGLGAYC